MHIAADLPKGRSEGLLRRSIKYLDNGKGLLFLRIVDAFAKVLFHSSVTIAERQTILPMEAFLCFVEYHSLGDDIFERLLRKGTTNQRIHPDQRCGARVLWDNVAEVRAD
jgi:hypothetical protein